MNYKNNSLDYRVNKSIAVYDLKNRIPEERNKEMALFESWLNEYVELTGIEARIFSNQKKSRLFVKGNHKIINDFFEDLNKAKLPFRPIIKLKELRKITN